MTQEKYRRKWGGPALPNDLPQKALERLRLQCHHGITENREDAVSKALSPIMGKARIAHHGLRRYLTWHKSRWQVTVRVTGRHVHVRAVRLKPSQLRAIVEALMELEGTRDLEISGRFTK